MSVGKDGPCAMALCPPTAVCGQGRGTLSSTESYEQECSPSIAEAGMGLGQCLGQGHLEPLLGRGLECCWLYGCAGRKEVGRDQCCDSSGEPLSLP